MQCLCLTGGEGPISSSAVIQSNLVGETGPPAPKEQPALETLRQKDRKGMELWKAGIDRTIVVATPKV